MENVFVAAARWTVYTNRQNSLWIICQLGSWSWLLVAVAWPTPPSGPRHMTYVVEQNEIRQRHFIGVGEYDLDSKHNSIIWQGRYHRIKYMDVIYWGFGNVESQWTERLRSSVVGPHIWQHNYDRCFAGFLGSEVFIGYRILRRACSM